MVTADPSKAPFRPNATTSESGSPIGKFGGVGLGGVGLTGFGSAPLLHSGEVPLVSKHSHFGGLVS